MKFKYLILRFKIFTIQKRSIFAKLFLSLGIQVFNILYETYKPANLSIYIDMKHGLSRRSKKSTEDV